MRKRRGLFELIFKKKIDREISKLQAQQSEFLGVVAHDLRTPMTSIAGFVDGILDGTIPSERQEHYLKIVSAETHRLSRLVSNLLNITRIQSGKESLNITDFDVCENARLALISLEQQINAKNIEIDFSPCSDKCYVSADSEAIHQVLYNLLHNAIKFTEDGGKISISIEKQEDLKYILSVTNTGNGIPVSELPYVFDRFYKTGSSGGAGLGLFICKTIIDLHGEKIWAVSEQNDYTSFKLTLPVKKKND